jgi:hypothetical protein
MDNCKTKEELINFYRDEYEEQFHRPFLELALTKLGNLSDTNPVGLKDDQRDGIQEKLSNSNFSTETFLSGLELLSFQQICYVGW